VISGRDLRLWSAARGRLSAARGEGAGHPPARRLVQSCRPPPRGPGGYRWRAESGGLPPDRLGEVGRSGRYLSRLERQRIATLHREGFSIREIARILGRSPSTISRELRRNTSAHDGGRYDGDLAHARARQRARRPRRNRLSRDDKLRRVVQSLLGEDWSPEQIAAYLRRAYPDRASWHLCHETIYQALYHGGKGGLSRTLTRRLRRGRPLRKRRRRPDVRETRYANPGKLIDARPAIALERSRVGDWEGDLILGARSQSAIGALVDRRSGFVRLVHLPHGYNSEQCRLAISRAIDDLPEPARLTLTWDQGSEMAQHIHLAPLFAEGVYFAHPGSPWMRPTNENTNGLLRQYFPKKTDLRLFSAADLVLVQDRLNRRPRKRHGWDTPAEVFAKALCKPPL
jgi:IS30 family transposase